MVADCLGRLHNTLVIWLMPWWTGSPLVQVVAYLKQCTIIVSQTLWDKFKSNSNKKYGEFNSRKCIWTYCLQKCRPFCFSLNVITPIAPLACNYTHLSQGNFAITLITLLSSAMTDVQCSYKACGNPTIGPAKARVEVRAARPTKLPAKCKVNWSRLVYSTWLGLMLIAIKGLK